VGSGEFLGELLRECVSRRISNLIYVILHISPSFCLGFVFAILQLLYLLDVMTAVREQQTPVLWRKRHKPNSCGVPTSQPYDRGG
jgi:hypothetical protein